MATGEALPWDLTADEGPEPEPPSQPCDQTAERRRGLLTLAVMVTIVGIAGLAEHRIWWAAILFVALIVPMVLFHEWGHFRTAKRFGIASKEFFVGFGPRLWSIRKGETEYGIKAFFPLGGYVKIVGMSQYEEVEPRFVGRTFRDAKRWQRAIVLAAGSTTHFITALVLIFVVLVVVGVPTTTTTVGEVVANSPAVRAGLKKGDEIAGIDGREVDSWQQVTSELRGRGGEQVAITVLRGGKQLTVEATPESVTEDGKTFGRLGVVASGILDRQREYVGVAEAVPETFRTFGRYAWTSVVAVKETFAPSNLAKIADQVGGGKSRTELRPTSPYGIGSLMLDAMKSLYLFLVLFIAINVFVGMFNLLPVLPLDGGHLAVLGIEAVVSKVRRRPFEFDQRHLMPITIAVLALLMIIFVSSFYLDVVDTPRLQ